MGNANFGKRRKPSDPELPEPSNENIPIMIRWHGGGQQVSVAGTFSGWQLMAMVLFDELEYALVVEVPEGRHEYKYLVDGDWVHDPTEPTVKNAFGTYNNVISVDSSNYEVHNLRSPSTVSLGLVEEAVPGDYGQVIPEMPELPADQSEREKILPTLPAALLETAAKADPSPSEPCLLPFPPMASLNHVFTLPLKDEVMVIAATFRYRKKFVTCLFHKAIYEMI